VQLVDRALPRSASPIEVSLVPVFQQCGTLQRQATGNHAPPLGAPSCAPARGTAAAFGPEATASSAVEVLPGDAGTPGDEADVALRGSIADVRAGTAGGPDYNPNAGGPDLTLITRLRITDDASCAPVACVGPHQDPATASDLDFSVPIDCSNTAGAEGAACTWDTTADAVLPGSVPEGKATVAQVFRVRITDSGPNGARGDFDDALFAQQGIYVP
jgi:hypothetical protein